MTRSVFRYVNYTIRHVSDGGVTFEAFCTSPNCGKDSGPHDDQAAAQDWCLRHTGTTGHEVFLRVVTDHAHVTRDQ